MLSAKTPPPSLTCCATHSSWSPNNWNESRKALIRPSSCSSASCCSCVQRWCGAGGVEVPVIVPAVAPLELSDGFSSPEGVDVVFVPALRGGKSSSPSSLDVLTSSPPCSSRDFWMRCCCRRTRDSAMASRRWAPACCVAITICCVASSRMAYLREIVICSDTGLPGRRDATDLL